MVVRLSLAVWKYLFVHRYAEYVGISWESAGGDDDEVVKYYDLNYTPAEAVLDQMRKYDLKNVR
jgi:hypothetical protein